jgi:hypothetical protein
MTDQRNEDDDTPIVDIDHLLDAIEATIAAAPTAKRTALAKALAAHMNDCPVEHATSTSHAYWIAFITRCSISAACGPIVQSPNSRATFA